MNQSINRRNLGEWIFMTSATQWTRVILLMPPRPDGRGLSDGVKSLFAQRDWFAVEQHDPHLALAELCLRERAQIARSAWGLQRMEQIALVVVQPDFWRKEGHVLDDLIAAIVRFVPSTSVWTVIEDEVHALHTPHQAASLGKSASALPEVQQCAGLSPTLRMASDGLPLHPNSPGEATALEPLPPRRVMNAPTPLNKPAIATGDNSVDDRAASPHDEDDPAMNSRITRKEIDMLLEMPTNLPSPSSPPSANKKGASP